MNTLTWIAISIGILVWIICELVEFTEGNSDSFLGFLGMNAIYLFASGVAGVLVYVISDNILIFSKYIGHKYVIYTLITIGGLLLFKIGLYAIYRKIHGEKK